ncbi:helix-turn-helix domain-containing protein [Neiella marina]|uniref:Helix-turn-helix domain-containing protein n=1 Tax=Neiella holothuriorum TaxID=2870530 RepID=A0ABS7EIT1_9GAMM|nr:DNA-3-methyladenine glycosylase 2 family protein [Neiella holothuriorum]MBW8192235.1 helix-turn-helix domain-containing protein [Neiella holothuriorum]
MATETTKQSLVNTLTDEQCRQARLARDARFDGRFFVAVKTTGIFCRPICPASPPLEENVSYFAHAATALHQGFRPCLRCRPDSAPQSYAWRGVETTVQRAIALINQGALQHQTLAKLSERLGVSDRHLRQLFQRFIGISPKQFEASRRLLLAKQLLHQSHLPITQIALASGFNSVRRFNDAFTSTLQLQPRQIRRRQEVPSTVPTVTLQLAYRPPFNWAQMLAFLRARAIDGLEQVGDHSYARTIELNGQKTRFDVRHHESANALQLSVQLNDLSALPLLIAKIRRLFDLDADSHVIDGHLKQAGLTHGFVSGIRLPGIWSVFEAGVRAILGQQVSVKAARNLVQQVVQELGERLPQQQTDTPDANPPTKLFPTPQAVAESDLMFLKMPNSRRQSLLNLASYCRQHGDSQPDDWLALKGIGPWTVDYVKLRGLSNPNIFLKSDLGVKNALKASGLSLEAAEVSPWGSYATFQLWNQLGSQP